MNFRMRHLSTCLIAVLFFLGTSSMQGQSAQGSLRGLVTDSSGAAIPNLKVTLTDEGKKTVRIVSTDGAGQYVFTALDPATYTVSTELSGFKSYRKSGVVVGAEANGTADIALVVGTSGEVVQVTSNPLTLGTADANTGATITAEQLNDLPTLAGSGRSPYTASQLSANVVPVGGTIAVGFTDQSNVSYITIGGSPEASNGWLVDGIPISDTINRPVFIPAIEAIQETKVQVTTYDAEMARTGGGVFNTILKSGENRVHGSLYGVTKEANWNANSWSNNHQAIKVARANVPYYNYAGSLGGPVVIPHLYNGIDKTFFFIAEEGFRGPGSGAGSFSIPTLLERTGDFSQSFTTTGALNVIYDPTSTTTVGGVVSRTPFPGNVIPANRRSSVGLAIASNYPTPNVATATGGLDFSAPLTVGGGARGDEAVFKLDHQFFPWWHASASYVHYGSLITFFNALHNVSGSTLPNYSRKVDATSFTSVFTINPTTIVSARFGFNRFPNSILPISQGFNPTTLGLPNYQYQSLFFPTTNVTNFTALGTASATVTDWYSRNFSSQITKNLGRHSLKAGFDNRSIYMEYIDLADASGTYNFTGAFTQANPTTAANGSGSSIADLVLGLPLSGQIERSQNFFTHVRYFGGYVQDDFRVNSKLTINAGVRYEYETGLKEQNNNEVVGFNQTVASPLSAHVPGVKGGLLYAGINGATQCCDFSKKKFAPRLGVSYAVTPKTAIRGGFALLYAPMRYDPTAALNTGYTTETPLVSSNNGGLTPSSTFSFSNPFPNGPNSPTGNGAGLLSGIGTPIAAYDQNLQSPRISQFSVDVQRELPWQVIVDVAYVASRGRHLLTSPQGAGTLSSGGGKTNIDQLNPSYFSLGSTGLNAQVANPFYGYGGTGTLANATVAQQQLLLPFPQFTSVNLIGSYSSSSYNSLAVKAEKRTRKGLTMLATFTWSRNMDNEYGLANTGPQNSYDLKSEWSQSFIDLPFRYTDAINYQLPFGHGQALVNHSNKIVDFLASGWETSFNNVIASGYPMGIFQTNANSPIGTSVQRPNQNAGIAVKTTGTKYARVADYLNKAAFTTVNEYQFGNTPRILPQREFGRVDFDASVIKRFTYKEKITGTFRAECENLFNHPDLGAPVLNVSLATFGTITATTNASRAIKLGGRINF